MSEHAIYAPSSAHRWIDCTASASGIAALGEQEPGVEAIEGTAAHEELERILSKSGEPDPDHPAAYGIALAIDYVRQLPPGRMYVEQRVRLTDHIWGRCDVAHWHEESATLTILDLKNGFVNVEAEQNPQLRIYAAGSIYTYKLPAKHIRYVVVQPNSFLPVPRVKQWVESADDLFRFAERVPAANADVVQDLQQNFPRFRIQRQPPAGFFPGGRSNDFRGLDLKFPAMFRHGLVQQCRAIPHGGFVAAARNLRRLQPGEGKAVQQPLQHIGLDQVEFILPALLCLFDQFHSTGSIVACSLYFCNS